MGRLFIISAPSGAGKTTLCKAILKYFKDMLYSISYTTRDPRKCEIDGTDYHFISKEDFTKGIEKGKWAEWAEVHGNFYGTSGEFLQRALESGHDLLLDIDVQGTVNILRNYPESITIFIMPPSSEALKIRMEARGTDKPEVIARRLVNAEKEMAQKDRYHHVIVNDDLTRATEELISVIEKYRISEIAGRVSRA